MSWKGTKEQNGIELRSLDSWAKIAKQADEDLLKTLESDNFSDRQRAQHEIIRRARGDGKMAAASRAELLKILRDANQKQVVTRIAALGALQGMWNDEVQAAFIDRLADFSPDIRRLVADALALHCNGDNDVHEALIQQVNDQDLAARRAIYLAIGRNKGRRCRRRRDRQRLAVRQTGR